MGNFVLTETAVKNAKPKDKPYKLADERGLFLAVQPSGAKWWRFRYYIWGKERMLSLGTYRDVSLKQARERRDEARSQVADGIDPSDVKKQHKHKHLQNFDDQVTAKVDELKLRAATMKKKRRVLGYARVPQRTWTTYDTAAHARDREASGVGLSVNVHCHVLRHSTGYALVKARLPIRNVQSYLGHAHIGSTVVYAHLDETRFIGTSEALS